MNKKSILVLFALLFALALNAQNSGAIKVRIKDVARLKGQESYTLVGYGLVIGLNGTGDSDESLIQRTIANLMENFNIVVDEDDIKAQNCAAVMVTTTIRGTAHKGDLIQANVSAVSDAKALTGGILLLTPVLGPDAETWGIAQGSVTVGGFSFGDSDEAGGASAVKNHPTSGMLTNGIKLLKDVGTGIENNDRLTYFLRKPDYTSAVNLANIVNHKYHGSAIALDNATITIKIPVEFRVEDRVTTFISEVEQLYFTVDTVAKVVFNERTGTIVMGADVRISNAAVNHANLHVDIKRVEGISQPNPFSETGTTQRINDTTLNVDEQKTRVIELPNTTTVGELVRVLNSLGVKSRDIMIIFHVLREAGALHAELEAI